MHLPPWPSRHDVGFPAKWREINAHHLFIFICMFITRTFACLLLGHLKIWRFFQFLTSVHPSSSARLKCGCILKEDQHLIKCAAEHKLFSKVILKKWKITSALDNMQQNHFEIRTNFSPLWYWRKKWKITSAVDNIRQSHFEILCIPVSRLGCYHIFVAPWYIHRSTSSLGIFTQIAKAAIIALDAKEDSESFSYKQP